MVSSILKQTAGILRKQKNSKRWQKGFWCLAIAVVVGTVAILTMTGQALTHKTKVLNCRLEVHEHTDECYDEDDNLICGYADYVVHVHNDDCYDSEGNLVCTLPEIEEHEHTEECYEEQEVLICEAAEAAGTEGHVHTEECYQVPETTESADTLSCGLEEHTHTDGCYSSTLVCDLPEGPVTEIQTVEVTDENGETTTQEQEVVVDPGHTHGEECYEKVLNCGTKEHTHNESCYTKGEASSQEPVLICQETEGAVIPGHTHSEECYKTEKVLTCGELELHTHVQAPVEEGGCYDESAFDEETGEFIEGSLPVCGLLQLEEHVHTEECFEVVELTDEEIESHAHSAKCYDMEGNLICGYSNAADHVHTEDCYDEEGNLVCGYITKEDAEHEHDAGCYDEAGNLTCGYEDAKVHEHDANCYDENGYITCGHLGVKAHEHDGDCYDEEGNLTCGYEGVKDHQHDAGCYDIFNNLICGYNGVSDHAHTEDCYDEEGNLICGYEVLEAYEFSKTFEGDQYIVVARYNADANLPEEAELMAEQITPDSDGEHYESRETEYREMLGDQDASMRALLKIGFYDENGQEIEPEAPVTVAVQFLDEDGLAEGKPITIVHFAEEGTEKLDGSNARDNSTTFKMESFSEVAIGYKQEEESRIEEDGSIHIADSFEQEADPFRIIFHVEGYAKPVEGAVLPEAAPENEQQTEESELSQGEGTEGEAAPSDAATEGAEGELAPADASAETVDEEETPAKAGVAADEEEEQAAEDETTADSEEKPEDTGLKFHVELLEEGSKMYEAVKSYVGESDDSVTRRILQALTYSMTYDDVELDLSECKITAEIIPGGNLLQEVQELAGEDGETEVAYSLTALGVTEDITDDVRVKELDSVELDEIISGAAQGKELADEVLEKPVDDESVEQPMDDVLAEDPTNDATGGELNGATLEVDNVAPKRTQMFRMSMNLPSNVNTVALSDESTSNLIFKVQYYAYVQKLATTNPGGAEVIKIIDTVQDGKDGKLNGAELPSNTKTPETRDLYVKKAAIQPATTTWPAYEPVYNEKGTVESLTKLYTTDLYEYSRVSGGLKYINKFAKDGMNYELCEVWVLKPGKKPDSIKKADWTVYSGDDINKLMFRNNNAQVEGEITVQVTKDTVIRLVGKSNTEQNKNYPARFFDYDFTDGTTNHVLQGINDPSNYKKNADGSVKKPRYGFGNNSSGATGLKDDKLNGYNINIARTPADSIIKKCSFGIVQSSLSSAGYPVIKANAPDLFNPQAQNVKGKTEISGRSLNFNRDGDTYTLTSVSGSEKYASNLDQFQKRPAKAYGTDDQIWTNQFWPMDNAPKDGHDKRFGKADYFDANGDGHRHDGLAVADDNKNHNNFFGMTFDVEFELTDDYTGPLNYYFFGDDDMWVFLEYPNRTSKLICDIGGVHQAAGEYVDLWNYIQMPSDDNPTVVDPDATDENQVKNKYKLKFFYTERGASGSTCWMQFTLPSVNAVPVKDYTGNVKNTLTLNKTVEGTVTDELFDFTITFFKDGASNVGTDNYPYEIKKEDGTLVKTGDIRSGGTFKLGHKQTIEVFNLPEGTTYTITETADGFEGVLGDGSTGTIEKDKTIEGTIDYSRDDIDDYINKAIPYELPETGGPGPIPYTIAGVLVALLGAGFMYRKKSGKEGAGIS